MKNKVPPPIWMLLTGAIMWLLSRSPVGYRVEVPWTAEAGTLLMALGMLVIAMGIIQFARVKTTVNPLDLGKSTHLATQGIYRFTRNPMYLGMAMLLVGWGLHLDSPTNLVCIAAFIWLMTGLQIKPEEAALRDLFGEEYARYCRQVRRWL